MDIEKLIITDMPNGPKRLKAEFYIKGRSKPLIRRFGSAGSRTYYDGEPDEVMKAYLARHGKLNEDWSDITTAGALSRFVLWYSPSRDKVEKFLKKKFKIPIVKISARKTKNH